MIFCRRLLWPWGTLVCLTYLVAACRPLPLSTKALLLPTSQVTSSVPPATPARSAHTPQVATPASPAPEPTLAVSPVSGGQRSDLATREVPEDLLEAILADAADRSGLPREAFAVIWAEAVRWSDGSLGCPQPGAVYAQAPTPGFRVILEAGGQAYEYHTGPTQSIVLCDTEGSDLKRGAVPSGVPPILSGELVTTPVSGNLEKLIDIAEQDLARRLEIAPAEVEVVMIERAEWPDTSLGCGQPGLARRPVAIAGYRLVLSAGGREYIYHTDRESGVVYCPKG